MTGRRALVVACLGLAGAAAALWGASAAVWYRVVAQVPVRGPVPVEVTGSEAAASVTGVALLALAGVAALVATGGVLRRLVGVLLATAGGAIAALALVRFVEPPAALPGLPSGVPADVLLGPAVQTTAAPLLAAVAGLLLLGVGLLVLLRERGMPRLGARYTAPGSRHGAPRDPDRAAWDDLDAGRDPTVEECGEDGPEQAKSRSTTPDGGPPTGSV